MKFIYTLCLIFSFQFLQAQCYPDRHNTNWYDAWISCSAAPNPNAVRGEGHWLLYNLGYVYLLKDSNFWNANNPDSLQNGLKNIVIDYSLDGTNWAEWGTFTLAQGTGKNIYEGTPGPDFDQIAARYVLITAIDNYGGNCYSLSELKINVAPCLNDLNITGTIEDGKHIAGNSITSDGTVNLPDSVVFDARNCITLEPEFEVKQGAEFTTKSDGCGEQIPNPADTPQAPAAQKMLPKKDE